MLKPCIASPEIEFQTPVRYSLHFCEYLLIHPERSDKGLHSAAVPDGTEITKPQQRQHSDPHLILQGLYV